MALPWVVVALLSKSANNAAGWAMPPASPVVTAWTPKVLPKAARPVFTPLTLLPEKAWTSKPRTVLVAVVESIILTNKPTAVPLVVPPTLFINLLPNWKPLSVVIDKVLVAKMLATALAPVSVVVPTTESLLIGLPVPMPTFPPEVTLNKIELVEDATRKRSLVEPAVP